MKINWCQEHESSYNQPEDTLCFRRGRGADWLTPCRMVPMRLIPDNAEPAGMLVYGEFIPYDVWVKNLPFAAPVDQVVALYALDGTP